MKNIKNIILFIIVLILFLFSDLFYLLPLNLLNINYFDLSNKIQMILSISGNLILIIILFFIYKDYLIEKFKDFKNNISSYMDIGFKFWFIGLLLMAFSNLLIINLLPITDSTNEILVQEMLSKTPILTFISASILAPILEEMIFRKCISDMFNNKVLMIIISGLTFGLLHVIFSYQTWYEFFYIISYGALGASFACSLAKTDNIYVPITFHAIHNGFLTLISIIPILLG